MVHNKAQSTQIAERILELVFARANFYPNCPRFAARQSPHFPLVNSLVESGSPIRMILPAFPAKSPNRQKTLGTLPDLGEVLALQLLNRLCEQIGRLYSPGASITICSDGRVFSDLVQVADQDVNQYAAEISHILSTYGLTHLDTYNLEDVFPRCSYDQMREKLTVEYATPIDELRQKVRDDQSTNQLFNGIHRFLFEDQLVLEPNQSRNQIRKQSKELAYEVIQRSNAWSALLQSKFPQALRLSIHPQSFQSAKIGIQMVRSQNIWATPWHNVAFFDGKEFWLIKKHEAEEKKAKVCWHEKRYPYYTINENVDWRQRA